MTYVVFIITLVNIGVWKMPQFCLDYNKTKKRICLSIDIHYDVASISYSIYICVCVCVCAHL